MEFLKVVGRRPTTREFLVTLLELHLRMFEVLSFLFVLNKIYSDLTKFKLETNTFKFTKHLINSGINLKNLNFFQNKILEI